ncbi:MAG TPA: hypothetical protein VGP77_00280 [Vicinamibacterales bacterium]|nr:hypothetical protein [Vicinamibacterales bacterium]
MPDDDDGPTLNSQDWLDLDKRRSILNGARTKERTKLLSSLGLRTETPLETLRPHLALMTSDVVEYHRQLTDSLQRRGLLPAAAAPPAPVPDRADPAPPQPRAMPQPDLQFSDGRRAYSAEGAADLIDWATQNLRDEWDQMLAARLGPMESTHAAVRGAQMRAEANQVAADVIAEASTWAYFDDFRGQIADLMAQDKRVTVHSAYNRLLQERLKTEPAKIREQARQATLQEIRTTTRNGGASIVPGQAIVAEKRKGSGGLDDLFEQAVNRALATTPAP